MDGRGEHGSSHGRWGYVDGIGLRGRADTTGIGTLFRSSNNPWPLKNSLSVSSVTYSCSGCSRFGYAIYIGLTGHEIMQL